MSIVRSGETAYDIEMQKWDTPKRMGGFGPDGFEAFPKMVYRAERREDKGGKVMCMDVEGSLYSTDPVVQARAEAFTNKCQRTVMSEGEYDRARGEGWCESPKAALESIEKHAQSMATAAAEVNYDVQRMSDKARREHAFLDASTDGVVAEVPVPKRKPGRPVKAVA